MRNLLCLFIVTLYINMLNGANILGIYFHAGKSHHILGEMLLKALALRGHNITMASPFPLKDSHTNYTDIHLTGIMEDQLARESMFMKMNKRHTINEIGAIVDLCLAQTELTLNHTEMKRLIESGIKFDVIIIDWFMNLSILWYGKIFNAPIIPIASQGTSILVNGIMGNPSPPSYIPTALVSFSSNMTFWQRMANGLLTIIYEYKGYSYVKNHMNLIKKYFNESPTYDQVRNQIALILSNAHYSYETPRPYVPNIIPVGGFHVQKPGKLPKDLQRLMDKATHGVIYFSLGSNMKSVLIPKEKQKEILQAFRKLSNYLILWKWENDEMLNKPDNVIVKKWFPQNEILAHPNLKLFISHGGLLSIIEALHYGIPVLGIPIFGDQNFNIINAERLGYAIHLDLNDINEKSLIESIEKILHNPSYTINAKKRSQLLHDQPLSPMDNAVFWVEHVIRHKGALHLKNSGTYLQWYQYLMLDVAIFLTISSLIIILLIGYYVRKCFKFLFTKKNERNKSKVN